MEEEEFVERPTHTTVDRESCISCELGQGVVKLCAPSGDIRQLSEIALFLYDKITKPNGKSPEYTK